MAVTSPESTAPEPAPVAPADTQPPKKRPTGLIVAAVVGATVVLVAAITTAVYALGPSGPDPKDPMSLLSKCREEVKTKMRAPATTQFPGGETVDATQSQSTIVGVFDSQNGFGALTRGGYRCLLAHNDDGTFRVVDVTIKDK
jgi:hypothetical protein